MFNIKIATTIFFVLLLINSNHLLCQNNHTKLWYNHPANAGVKDTSAGWINDFEWLKALPVGNGFIGAMIFGDVNKERLQLNEKSLWSGSNDDNDNPDASKYLNGIRQLLFEGKYKEATELTNKTQVCKGAGSGSGNGADVPYGCYQTLGDLWIDFNIKTTYANYYRELDLINGIALTRFKQNNIQFTRKVFASNPDKAIVIHLTADKANAISFTLSVSRPEKFTTIVEGNRLVMSGTLINGKGGDGMKYKVYAVPVVSGGSLKKDGNELIISKADAVTIIVTAATNYKLHYPDYINNSFEDELNAVTNKAVATPYNILKEKHVKDFSFFMKRSSLQLTSTPNENLPTDQLLEKNLQTKNEAGLYSLYYQFGRYVLLSSSREGSLPANLQGIWGNKIQTPWNGDYHTDINVQMNYWPSEVTNLSECDMQLIGLIESLVTPGTRTASVQYKMHGWCIHPITNVWGYTAPGEDPGWGLHVGATGWMCQHVWEHYAFTHDTNYLRKVYPILQQACLFYFDWLVKDPSTSKLVSGPASSPENSFVAPDGSTASISMGPSHDQEVIRDLFNNTLQAARELNISNDDAFIHQLQQTNNQIAMPGIGKDGRLMEWAQGFKEVEPHHRHSSHLFALYPGDEITLDKTPALAEAAKKSLEARGDDGTGWSLAWKINFWARLHDGNHALKLLNRLLQPAHATGVAMNNAGGTYNNLFCAHPPFQLDGNFGATAGIAEMLLQSQEDFIELLPALPSSWKDGSVKGLCARGGFVIDMQWKNNKLTRAILFSKKGGLCIIKYGTKEIALNTKAGGQYNLINFTQ
ncbi:glycosyl hydrolase family 95 catalytic domain-containing protein [Parafilimonas sp.]|uniref:glycoside hydrolase family 95 protein n=1 Tax=Parafilimonas sp. TaxID=1969739 RepID=UPI0039E4F27E